MLDSNAECSAFSSEDIDQNGDGMMDHNNEANVD
jgi:hypothetical protein